MKPTIYVANTSSTSVLANGVIPFNQIVRRYGSIVNLSGNGVRLSEAGYYLVTVNAEFTAPATGDVTISLKQDNVDVVGAIATETVATANTQTKTITLSGVVRVFCADVPSVLTVQNEGVAINMLTTSMVVTKL